MASKATSVPTRKSATGAADKAPASGAGANGASKAATSVAAGVSKAAPAPTSSMQQVVATARSRIAQHVYGHEHAVDALLVALAAGGHVLLDGIPGVGKTTLARTFAQVTGLHFQRIQLTPDLLPADIVGHSYYDQAKREFKVRAGPIMAQVVLADEINRTPPRTQAALLEAMQERQVTIEGNTLKLPEPFLLVATKNPVDLEGVYPLPGAELDRFMLSVRLGYPERKVEAGMLRGTVHQTANPQGLPGLAKALRASFDGTEIHSDLVNYVLDVVGATRQHEEITLGGSPRSGRHWVEAARGLAALRGRAFVTPDDLKAMALPVLQHRIVLRPEAEIAGITPQAILGNLLEQLPVPIARRA